MYAPMRAKAPCAVSAQVHAENALPRAREGSSKKTVVSLPASACWGMLVTGGPASPPTRKGGSRCRLFDRECVNQATAKDSLGFLDRAHANTGM